MGFTIGSGGGPPPNNSVSEDKIVDKAVSENKLSDAVVAQLGGVTVYDGSLVSNAAVASITGLSGRKTYSFTARGKSNANSNRIFFTVNADTTETFTNGRQLVNAATYSTTTDTLLLPSTISSGVSFEVTGTVSSFFDGTNTQIYLKINGYADSDAFRFVAHKQISGNVDLSSFAVRSNQANGLASGFYFKAQETA